MDDEFVPGIYMGHPWPPQRVVTAIALVDPETVLVYEDALLKVWTLQKWRAVVRKSKLTMNATFDPVVSLPLMIQTTTAELERVELAVTRARAFLSRFTPKSAP